MPDSAAQHWPGSVLPGGTPRTIHVRGIVRSEAAFPREKVDPARVALFASMLEDGHELPPILVVADGQGRYIRADGEHRLRALEQTGVEQVQAIVAQAPSDRGPEWHAYLLAVQAAAASSRPLTAKERSAAIERLDELLGEDTSDRELARMVGVSHQTVGRVRRGEVVQMDHASSGARILGEHQRGAAEVRGWWSWRLVDDDGPARRTAKIIARGLKCDAGKMREVAGELVAEAQRIEAGAGD